MFNCTQPRFDIDVFMPDTSIDRIRSFCHKINQGPVTYPIYTEIYGPTLYGKQSVVRLSCRYNYICFDVLKEPLSCGWGLIVSQLISLKFVATNVTYDYKKMKPDDFHTLHPYGKQIQFSNRVLASLSNNDSSIAKIHQNKITQIGEIMSAYKNCAKELLKNLD